MTIKIGHSKQRDQIFSLLQDCAAHLKSQQIFQWNENYPTLDLVEKDISTKALKCLVDENKIVGIIVIDETQSPEYKEVDWVVNNEKTLVVHRLAVLPEYQKSGFGRYLMDYALEFALTNNYKSIRLDAYSGNQRILDFYLKREYIKRGEIFFPYRELPFFCFEKIL